MEIRMLKLCKEKRGNGRQRGGKRDCMELLMSEILNACQDYEKFALICWCIILLVIISFILSTYKCESQ